MNTDMKTQSQMKFSNAINKIFLLKLEGQKPSKVDRTFERPKVRNCVASLKHAHINYTHKPTHRSSVYTANNEIERSAVRCAHSKTQM